MTDLPAEQKEGQANMVNVAALQFEPVLGEVEQNRAKLVELAVKAFEQQAQLIVAPECCVSGYVFNSQEEAADCAESLPDGPTVQALAELTAKYEGYVVAGLVEKEGELLYNTAVLVGPEGFIGKYRKVHLWDVDKTIYQAGNEFPVFDLPFGRLAISICYDGMFPEVTRIYAIKGVDIICHPTNWVVIPGIADASNPVWVASAASQAACSGVTMICADRIGVERGVTFGGHSCVCSLAGFHAPLGPFDEEAVIVAPVTLMGTAGKQVGPKNHLLDDRRTDLYEITLKREG
jgi:N-carbamoylputrescine amidase